MLNKRSNYLVASSIIAGLATFLFDQKCLLAQNLPPGTDLGYNNLPKASVDVNGDGLIDYCRFVGDAPKIFIACMLGTQSGFDINNQHTAFTSARGINQGYPDRPRGFRDVNGDGKADYCRFDGPPGKIQEYCNPAFSTGFGDDSQRILTGNMDPVVAPTIDPVVAPTSSLISPETSGTVNGPNKEVSMGGGYAEAEATFYRNGLVVMSTHSKSKSWSQGTKGSVFVVGLDTKGRALFVSPVFDIPTACSRADTCSSDRRGNVQYQVNSEVAKYVAKVDVYVQDRSGGRSAREAINNTIKESCATYNDLPASAKAGIAAETGFSGCGN